MADFDKYAVQIAAVAGVLNKGQDRALFNLAQAVPDNGTIVEIGSYCGKSSACLGLGAGKRGIKVYCIDPFDGSIFVESKRYSSRYGEIFKENMAKFGLLKTIVFPVAKTSAAAGKRWKAPINLLFLDGLHIYEAVSLDAKLFFPHVVQGGVIALHDSAHPGPARLWQELQDQVCKAGRVSNLVWGTKK